MWSSIVGILAKRGFLENIPGAKSGVTSHGLGVL